MVAKNKDQPVKLGSGVFARCENRMHYHRRKALARYYEQRLLIIAELGAKCHRCNETTGLQVIKNHDALLPFRVRELFQMARKRLPYHLAECHLSCYTHANEEKFGNRPITHGKWYSVYKLKCHCNECEEFRADYALRRREDRQRKRQSLSTIGSMEPIRLSDYPSDIGNGVRDDLGSDNLRP